MKVFIYKLNNMWLLLLAVALWSLCSVSCYDFARRDSKPAAITVSDTHIKTVFVSGYTSYTYRQLLQGALFYNNQCDEPSYIRSFAELFPTNDGLTLESWIATYGKPSYQETDRIPLDDSSVSNSLAEYYGPAPDAKDVSRELSEEYISSVIIKAIDKAVYEVGGSRRSPLKGKAAKNTRRKRSLAEDGFKFGKIPLFCKYQEIECILGKPYFISADFNGIRIVEWMLVAGATPTRCIIHVHCCFVNGTSKYVYVKLARETTKIVGWVSYKEQK
jgi:hypothetical protein